MRYRDFATREETIQFLYRYQQVTEGSHNGERAPPPEEPAEGGFCHGVAQALQSP